MRPAAQGRDVFANYTGTILQVSIIIPSTRSTLPPGLGQCYIVLYVTGVTKYKLCSTWTIKKNTILFEFCLKKIVH
jgi:hypothetical protein